MADAVQIRALSESDPGTIQVRIGDPVRFEANAGAEEIPTVTQVEPSLAFALGGPRRSGREAGGHHRLYDPDSGQQRGPGAF